MVNKLFHLICSDFKYCIMRNMMKFQVIFLLFFGMVACYDKDENYEYKPKTELSVILNGLKESYISLEDTLYIDPEIMVSNSEHELKYEWSIFMAYDKDKVPKVVPVTVIGEGKVLRYPVTEKPNSYTVMLRVVNKNTAQEVCAHVDIKVKNKLSEGFYVMKEVEGNSDLDLHFLDGEKLENLLYRKNGVRLAGAPNSCSVLLKYSYIDTTTAAFVPTTALALATKEDFHIVDVADLGTIYSHENMFYGEVPEGEESLFACFHCYGTSYFSDKGTYFCYYDLLWGSGGSGKFPVATAINGGCKPNINICSDGSNVFFFDELNGRFLCIDANGGLYDYPDQEGIPVNGIRHSLLFLGNTGGKQVAIFQDADDAEKLWLYELELVVEDPWWGGTMANPGNPITKISEISSEKLRKAECFCSNETSARILYFVMEGQVYAYDIDNETETRLTLDGLDDGEEIRFIRHRYWTGALDPKENFDCLVVGTQAGNNYKICMYDLIGGMTNGNVTRLFTGKGRAVGLQFVTPGFEVTSAVQGDYPVSY